MHSDGRCLPCAHTHLYSPHYIPISTVAPHLRRRRCRRCTMHVTACRPAYNNSKFVYSTYRNKINANTKGKHITYYLTGRRERENRNENRLNQNQNAFKF